MATLSLMGQAALADGCLGCAVLRKLATNQVPEVGAQGMALLLGDFLQLFSLVWFYADANCYHPRTPQGRPASPRFAFGAHNVTSAIWLLDVVSGDIFPPRMLARLIHQSRTVKTPPICGACLPA